MQKDGNNKLDREEVDKRIQHHYRWNSRLVLGVCLAIFILALLPDRFLKNYFICTAITLASYLLVDFVMTWYGKRSN